MVTSGRTGVDAELMAALPNLGAVVNFGVGYDTTDVDAAAARGVGVSNTPDVLTDCVADTAVGLMIDMMRQFSASDRYVRAGRWPVEGNYPLTRQVSNTRVGIIGLGRIGSAIAKRLSAFGCAISYHNRRQVEGSPYTYVASPVELARGVDVLIVAAAGGAGTQKLVSREVIDALGRGRIPDQHRAGQRRRRGRVGRRFGRRPAGGSGPGCVRRRAERAGGAADDGQRRRAAARRQRHGGNPRGDGGPHAAQPGQLPEVGAVGHAGADAGHSLGLAPGAPIGIPTATSAHPRGKVSRCHKTAIAPS